MSAASSLAEAETLLLSGDVAACRGACLELLRLQPDDPQVIRLDALVCVEEGKPQEAIAKLHHVIASQSPQADWLCDIGLLYLSLNQPEKAIPFFRRGHEMDPELAAVHRPYASALLQTGDFEAAAAEFEVAILFEPHSPSAWAGLGQASYRLSRYPRAAEALDRSLTLHNDPAVLELLIRTLQLLCRHDEALAFAHRFFDADPNDNRALSVLAFAHWDRGDLAEGNRLFDEFAARGGVNAAYASQRLAARLHDSSESAASLRQTHEEWSTLYVPPPTAQAGRDFPNSRKPDRKLRIGYLSGEFLAGPAFHFLYPILASHNPEQFEIYCYHSRGTHDPATEKCKSKASHWREVAGLSDQDLVTQIRGDAIDILVDLSGHYPGNRLTAFTLRAAPVQVAYPNYPGTTGSPAIDYILTDCWVCPAGAETQYSERAWRVPSGYLTWQPAGSPAIPPLPALLNGHVTFGLFQRPLKLNPSVWDAVAGVLRAVPCSRLLIQFGSRDLDHPSSRLCREFTAQLESRGIAGARLHCRGPLNLAERYAYIAGADIALDTFPYNGQTTTCECLWMGVPVVTLLGDSHVSRVGHELLSRADLPDCVSRSASGYVAAAARLASDLPALSQLRASLRDRLAQSPITGHNLVTGEIEAAFRDMWREWCDRITRPSSDPHPLSYCI